MGHPDAAKMPQAPTPDLGAFRPLPDATLEKLLARGREDAAKLAEAIRGDFELSPADAGLRLR